MVWFKKADDVKESSIRRPAIHALVKVTVEPQIMALKAKDERSDFLSGTREPIAPNVMPMDEKLAKPHKAYVAIVWVRTCETCIN